MTDIAEPFNLALNGDGFAGDGCRRLHILGGRVGRQPESKGRAFANFALHGQVAAHQARQPPTDRQPEPAALAWTRLPRLSLDERIENRNQLLFRNTAARIRHAKTHVRPLRLQPRVRVRRPELGDLHRNSSTRRRELHRVGKQVDQNLARPLVVAPINRRQLGQRKHRQLETPCRRLRLDERDRRGDSSLRRGRPRAHLKATRFDLRQIQYVVDE